MEEVLRPEGAVQGVSVVNADEALHEELFPLHAVCTWNSYVVPEVSPVNDFDAEEAVVEVQVELPFTR